jgi:phospholipid/cholesterol/gamma-HCH transport system substrate-binding protein
MNLTRRIKIQLAVFTVVAVAAISVIGLAYVHLPSLLFGIGRYNIRIELPEAANLYPTGNVTYRGTEVGRVTAVHPTDTGAEAELSLNSDISIPSDLDAQVHSATAIGEQYVALLPRNATSPPLKDGDAIPATNTTVPPDINQLLDTANRGLQAIPHDNLKTLIDESNTAFAGLGPELSRFIKGATSLAIDAHKNTDAIVSLIDNAKPVLDTQTDTSNAVAAWAAHLATITGELKTQDNALAGVLDKGPAAADQARALLDRLNPTLPTLLANLVSVGQVAVTYQNDLEQLLVLVLIGIQSLQGISVPDENLKTPYRGNNLSFHLDLNMPPPCTTGFLPPQQRRDATFQDYPARPAGDLYCRTPQDSPFNVRGARNLPCETVPGKRAPTVAMCESDEHYVPLNDGNNWKGDPNATLSGQDIPQLPPGSPPPAAALPAGAPSLPPVPAIGVAEYDPNTGTYLGPDGQTYTQTNLAANAPKEQTWQSMLTPPSGQ